MIVKPLKITESILQSEALARRLPESHPQRIELEGIAGRQRAGYNGEAALQFPLSFLDEDNYFIFYDLRLRDRQDYFQIDMLILTSSFLLIVEVKNVKGKIIYDDMGQAIRIHDQVEEPFINPIDQVNLQHLRLLRWLRQYDFPAVPLEKIVVYTNHTTLLINSSSEKEIKDLVIRKEKLLPRILQLSENHKHPILTKKQISALCRKITHAHSPAVPNLMEKYQVESKDLKPGVFCPECSAVPMDWQRGKWVCQGCGIISKDAHIAALEEYRLLFGKYITNREARAFLRIESADAVKRLLQKLHLKHLGKTKSRRYKLIPIDNS